MRRHRVQQSRSGALGFPVNILALAALVFVVAVLGGCGLAGAGAENRMMVVSTVAPLTSIVAAIGGGRVVVRGTIPEGVDSHTFEPRPSTSAALARARVVFVNGLGLEEPVSRAAGELVPEGSRVVRLGDRTLPRREWIFDRSFPSRGGRPNPHLWTSPPRALAYARVVRDELSRAAPRSEVYFRARYRRFAAVVRRLDAAARADFETIPRGRRKLVTYHDGYAYFARDYGFQVVGAIQAPDLRDPSPRSVRAIVDQIKAEKVPAVFSSEVFPSRVLEQVGRETGARYVTGLRDDDLPGQAGDPEHSWAGLVRRNFIVITESLGGRATALRALSTGRPGAASFAR